MQSSVIMSLPPNLTNSVTNPVLQQNSDISNFASQLAAAVVEGNAISSSSTTTNFHIQIPASMAESSGNANAGSSSGSGLNSAPGIRNSGNSVNNSKSTSSVFSLKYIIIDFFANILELYNF